MRAEINKNDFVSNIASFDTKHLKKSVKDEIFNRYLNLPEWDPEKIKFSSKPAGFLAKWVDSQLKYADMLTKVKPLSQQIEKLEETETALIKQRDELEELLDKLEKQINQYQVDYSKLTGEAELIKIEMQTVEAKVKRAESLKNNLGSEKDRWSVSSKNFQQQMGSMCGDVLICGAFLSYIGFFDHFYRRILMSNWREYLKSIGLIYKQDLSHTEYLSKASDRLVWQASGLPQDNLCIENAIILHKFHRYPLVIDPSGQALNYILKYYEKKKITSTSFADASFMKNLETSLRFGCPLLVQDVEKIDPILNSVLNKELHKTGGRVLIRVGD